jgi:hypothetical protein
MMTRDQVKDLFGLSADRLTKKQCFAPKLVKEQVSDLGTPSGRKPWESTVKSGGKFPIRRSLTTPNEPAPLKGGLCKEPLEPLLDVEPVRTFTNVHAHHSGPPV